MIGTITLLGVLFVVITIHEAGHLIVAKLNKVKVNTYSIGFGHRIVGAKFYNGKVSFRFFNCKPTNSVIWDFGETEYRLAPFLFGGFCAMEGEIKGGDNPHALANRPYFGKVAVAMAGVFANIVTGYVALCSLIAPKIGVIASIKETTILVYEIGCGTFQQLYMLVTGQVGISTWSELSEQAAQMTSMEGLVVQFGLYSILIAIFNLIPFPALDGSLPFLWCIERILGKERGEKLAKTLATIGFVLLMGLQIGIVIYWIVVAFK